MTSKGVIVVDITLTLRSLVEATGKTQRELAVEMKISEVYLSRLLHEPSLNPSVAILDRVTGVLGVRIDEILHPEAASVYSFFDLLELRRALDGLESQIKILRSVFFV